MLPFGQADFTKRGSRCSHEMVPSSMASNSDGLAKFHAASGNPKNTPRYLSVSLNAITPLGPTSSFSRFQSMTTAARLVDSTRSMFCAASPIYMRRCAGIAQVRGPSPKGIMNQSSLLVRENSPLTRILNRLFTKSWPFSSPLAPRVPVSAVASKLPPDAAKFCIARRSSSSRTSDEARINNPGLSRPRSSARLMSSKHRQAFRKYLRHMVRAVLLEAPLALKYSFVKGLAYR